MAATVAGPPQGWHHVERIRNQCPGALAYDTLPSGMPRAVPFVDLTHRHAQVARSVEDAVVAVLRSGRWIDGPAVARAEALAARWFGRSRAVGVASGTDALMLAMQSAGVRPGDEVIVPALTFFATAGAVVGIGAHPVVCDVGPDALLDAAQAASLVGPRTRAIIPVHLFGSRADHPGLDLIVVDDAAQAVGCDPPATIGVLTAVSAYPTKTWGAAGDAGFVVGDDDRLLDGVHALGRHGASGAHVHQRIAGAVGRASRLDEIQAAILVAHAEQLQARLAHRRALANRYDGALPPSVASLPRTPGGAVSHYCVRVSDRPRVTRCLTKAGIGHAVYYPRTLPQQPALAGVRCGPTPVASRLANELLALPVHQGVHGDDVDYIAHVLTKATA